MPQIWPIICDTSTAGGTGGGALAAIGGYSLTAPARPMDLIGHVVFGLNTFRMQIHNTSWPSPDPGIDSSGVEYATAMDRITWYPKSWIKPSSVFTIDAYATTTEDTNAILYLLDDNIAQTEVLNGPALTGNPYAFQNLPQPGRLRVLRNTETPTANVFEEMQGVTWNNEYLSSDCDYYIISMTGHSATSGALRFFRVRSNKWGTEYAPVFPGFSDTSYYHDAMNAYGLYYKHPGSETLFADCYNASNEATIGYLTCWEHQTRR